MAGLFLIAAEALNFPLLLGQADRDVYYRGVPQIVQVANMKLASLFASNIK